MCPEVIFTSDTFQINYFKETTCEVHKKVLPGFLHYPSEETFFMAAQSLSMIKMVNYALNWQCLSFIKIVPEGKGFSQSGAGNGGRYTNEGGRSQGHRKATPQHIPLWRFACCICKSFNDQTLQLCANICQCINVILTMLHMRPTNRKKPKPHESWFIPTTGWTCWQI